jgi:hypothetical protein
VLPRGIDGEDPVTVSLRESWYVPTCSVAILGCYVEVTAIKNMNSVPFGRVGMFLCACL